MYQISPTVGYNGAVLVLVVRMPPPVTSPPIFTLPPIPAPPVTTNAPVVVDVLLLVFDIINVLVVPVDETTPPLDAAA